MDKREHKATGQLISIQGADVTRIEYRGEPVVTFAMVDSVHQRPDGTAKRNFGENKSRFVEGEDFISAPHNAIWSDEIRTTKGGNRKPIVLLPRRGYLKLTKPMNDDRAWAVQGEMIDRYFMVEQIAEAMPAVKTPNSAREARLFFKQAMALAKIAGLRGNQLLIAANRATRSAVGFDHLAEMGLDYMIAPDNDVLLNPTDLGKQLGAISAFRINHLLAEHGYQTGEKDAKGRGYWLPTEKGVAAGGQMVEVERSNKTGAARQLRWPSSMVEVLRGIIGGAA